MDRRPTIHDVAAAAGVSVAAASKAINGRYGVAADTAARVLRAADELGYEPGRRRPTRTGVIGVLVSDFEPFSAELLKGVAAALRETDYDLLAYRGSWSARADWESRSLSRLGGTLIDGAIIVTPSTVSITAGVPIVAVDPHTGPGDLPTVESDSFQGGRQATAHLIELGHTRIALVGGRPDLRSAAARESGYRKALHDAGLPVDPDLVGVGNFEPDLVRQVATTLLARPARPTAVFAANDISALSVMRVAADLGLAVPDDLSVVGFDDIPEAARADPALTTIRQPMKSLGGVAAELLTRLMRGERPAQTHLVLPTRLIRRSTTAAPDR